jgi:hypothetical protein
MPCVTQPNLTETQREVMRKAIGRLEAGLATGNASAVIGANGAIAFKGWHDAAGVSDLCAYRQLLASNSPALRRAIARAEAMSGRKLDQRAVSAGIHSHDFGATWHKGH